MIEIKKLNKSYGEHKVLEDINLTVNEGEVYGFIGSSGVGKSTLLDCINGLEEYQTGSITVGDVKVENLCEEDLRKLRKNMGMIFQNFSLLKRKNVYKNIALPMECWGYSKEEIDEKVKSLASLVGLSDKLYVRPDKLSGGQKQRVAIARALALEPKYLLCDECTSALDPRTTLSILELLKNINKNLGITIIIVTHEMKVVKYICDRVAILADGKIAEQGYVEELFTNKSYTLKKLLGEEDIDFDSEFLSLKLDKKQKVLVEKFLKSQKISYSIEGEESHVY